MNNNGPEWYDSLTGMFGAMSLAGFLTSCAWLMTVI